MEYADLEPAADRHRLRFIRRLAHPQERVWRAISEPEHLQAWFPQRIVGEWRIGAPLRFEHPNLGLPPFDGEVIAVEPPRLLEFSWGPDVIRLEIAPDADNCVLTLTDTIEELGKAARDGAGWHVCLDDLVQHLDGGAPLPGSAERWEAVHPGYVDRFGPAAATIGPPAEWHDAKAAGRL